MTPCLIIEDQPPAQRILKKYIGDLGTLELRGTYTDAVSAARHIQQERIDLLFLDINLPKLSGTDWLRGLSDPPAVIFTTAYPDYALEGYELSVVDYLLKPFSFARFVQAVNKAQPTDETPAEDIFIKSGYEYIRIRVADIEYLEAGSDYTTLMVKGKKHLSPEPLRDWLERLGEFVRIHRSYAVNLSRVERLVGSEIFLTDQPSALPVGRAYKEEVMRRLGVG